MTGKAKGSLSTNVVLVSVVLAAIILGLFLLPVNRHDYRGAELKAKLHNIQLSVERYAVDNEGNYPQYLIGGEPGSAGAEMASDPLLRGGYLDAYPGNPFSRPRDQYKGLAVLELQRQLSKSTAGPDPLRPDYPDGDSYGYRFGRDGSLMGQVLCEARWPTRQGVDPATGEAVEHPTWADVEYRFWDIWLDKIPKPVMPGEFFYKSAGVTGVPRDDLVIVPGEVAYPKYPVVYPEKQDIYILGAYGKLGTKGKDVIGDEHCCTLSYLAEEAEASDAPVEERIQTVEYWMGTNSELDPAGRQGSPYSTHCEEQHYGNPNGFRDGVILVLTNGVDICGDR